MPWIAVIPGLVGLLALPRLWRHVRRTTLAAPWCWVLASGLAVLFVAWQGADNSLLNYSAAVTTLLPAAAIYGAKRPQDRGWQWIVAALLLMLIWPAGESYFLERSFDLAAQPLRAWFLVLLLAVQGGNWLITSNAGPVLLLTAAQLTMLWPQLPWGDGDVNPTSWLIGASMLAVVPWWVVLNFRPVKRDAAVTDDSIFPTSAEIDEWKSFRAAYGVVWALRVTERINEVAVRRGWPWRWSWSGTANAVSLREGAPMTALDPAAEQAVWRQLWHNIFRRFLEPADFAGAQNAEAHSP